jgi:hypothetical protein
VTRWERLLRWEEAHRFAIDATGTAALLLLMVVTATDVASGTSNAMRSFLSPLISVAVVAPLAWRRVRPAASAAAVYTAALLHLAFWTPLVVPADLAVLLALYSVTVHGPRWAHRVAIVGALVGSGLLGVLRGGTEREPAAELQGPGGLALTPAPGFAPQPAESDIGALVDQVRASGLRASLVRMGEPRHLPPGAGLTVFRIAQEALTNVLKHAGPDPEVTVLVQWLPGAIVLEVSDDGRGASADADGLGQGLLGMRERATMFGGSVTAGPRPGGGFRVRARLPTPGDAASGDSPTDERTDVPRTQDEATR